MLKSTIIAILSLVFATGISDSASTLSSFYLYSDTSDWVSGPDTPLTGANAVLSYTSPWWTTSVSGASYIWDSYKISNPSVLQQVQINKKFYMPGRIVSGTMWIACDDFAWAYLNGIHLDQCDGCFLNTIMQCDLTDLLKPGVNFLQITAGNVASPGSTPESNPGAVVYKIELTSDLSKMTVSSSTDSNIT